MCFAIAFIPFIPLIKGLVVFLGGLGVGTAVSGILRTRRENTADESDLQDEPKRSSVAPIVGIAAALFFFLPRRR